VADRGSEREQVLLRKDEGDGRESGHEAVVEGLHITFKALDMLCWRRERESDADFREKRDEVLEDRFCISMDTVDAMTMTSEGFGNVGHASLEDVGGGLVRRPDDTEEGGDFIDDVNSLRASTGREGGKLRKID
jgi:hypothetical protein